MPPHYLLAATGTLLQRLARFDAPADATLSQFQREHPRLGARDRQRIGDAAFTALRCWALLQHWLQTGATAVPDSSAAQGNRLAVLAFALETQLPLPAPLPPAAAEAALRQARAWSCDPAEQAWLDACLQAHAATPALPEACQHNLPDWLAQRLQAQYGAAQFWPLVDALKQSAPLDVRVNLLMHKRTQVQQQWQQAGIASMATPYSPWGVRLQGKPALRQDPLMRDGSVEVQDEGSQLLALLSDARRGETVVDFCAGAGGKTLALGAMMRNTGRLYAFDNSAHRLAALQPRLARSGLSNVHTMVLQSERDERLQRLHGKVDRVLVDAPCSGTGTLRRHPELAWRQQPDGIAALRAQQLAIVQAASALLRPGGTLVYATCSLLDDENTQTAQAFEQLHGTRFEPLDWTPVLKKHGLQALQAAAHGATAALPHSLALLPHLHHTDGFFITGWRRRV